MIEYGNQDLNPSGLLKPHQFIGKILNWPVFEERMLGTPSYEQREPEYVPDGELAHEIFHVSKSETQHIMETAFFPVIDIHEHTDFDYKTNVFVKQEHDKMAKEVEEERLGSYAGPRSWLAVGRV